MTGAPIILVGDYLLVPIQAELHDIAAADLQVEILSRIEETGADGLIIDISSVQIVDSFLGRLLGETSKMAEVMGCKTVLVGMRKEVALTLIQLGMSIKDIQTALTFNDGLELLQKLRDKKGKVWGSK
ncbi:MAG: STAS domain-containing protein [Candidatus Riflebacteria bacterium]|nr:STAS domain-containing protein [Candidatus Riflebacteria bacterium]